MKSLLLLITLSVCLTVGLATKDAPKYQCPEEDVDFKDNTIGDAITGVPTWEDCGMDYYNL